MWRIVSSSLEAVGAFEDHYQSIHSPVSLYE